MILEGPFLEQVVAGYLVKNGKEVVPRLETGGIPHDILVKSYDGYIVYECTGQREITEQKIDRFHSVIFKLHDILKKIEGKGIIEAVFTASVNDDAWTPSAKEAIVQVKESLKKRIGADLKVISGLELIKELIRSGILGLRLVRGRVHFAGPEDYAIRYDPNNREFKMSFAPLSDTELSRFRKLPHSFLPSYYWESHYKDLYIESSEGKEEQLTIWSYHYEEGVRWPSIKDMTEAYSDYINAFRRAFVIDKGDDYLIELYESARKNRYYSVHIFSIKDKFDYSEASEVIGKAIRLIDKIKASRSYLEKEPFTIYVHSASEDWSFKAWGAINEGIPEPLASDISGIIPEKGNMLILNLLNLGILGLRFRKRNEITLVGPGVNAARISKKDSGIDIAISEKPWLP